MYPMIKEDKLFFSYSQLYQIAFILPLYKDFGGTFLARNFRRWVQFKKYMRGASRLEDKRTFLKTPPVKIFDTREYINWQGVIISPSAIRFHPDNRNITTIFTGHGSGDKPDYGKDIPEKVAAFDYYFIAGPKQLKMMEDMNVAIPDNKLIKIGNMRFDDYVNGNIDREQILDNLGVKDRERLNILYAPTWSWGDGTPLKYGYRLCKELCPYYNLIIRPHGHDRMHIPKMRRWVKKEGMKNIYFSNPADLVRHDTMEDFFISDLLISDMSTIIYEYLITDKPIIVIKNDFKNAHRMPGFLKIDHIAEFYDESVNMFALIERSFEKQGSKEDEYQELRNNCFYFNDGQSTQRAIDFLSTLEF